MPGPPTSMPLPQSFLAMLIPVIDPQRNGTVMHLQVISYFSRGLPIQAHQNPLDAQHYSRFLILLCLASNFQQLGDGGLISVRECWAHIAHHCSFFGVCRIIYAHLYRSCRCIHTVHRPRKATFPVLVGFSGDAAMTTTTWLGRAFVAVFAVLMRDDWLKRQT